ncbi:hypothetical protein A2U01_0046637, partial [Trifolium medium]|nr:hypothetical protein [Trifolium medium]
DGRPKTTAKLIDTKKLLGCKTSADLTAFWLDMTSAQARLRQARNAKKKTAELTGTSSSVPLVTSSDRTSPAPSVEIVHEKRPPEDDLGNTHTSRKNRRVDDVEDPDNSLSAGLHRLTPGVPAAKFVLPPAFSHGQLFDGETKMTISNADEAILADM